MKEKKSVEKSLAFRGRIIWLFIKYQLLSKGLWTLILSPIYSFIIELFLQMAGRTEISSGDFRPFIFSPYGAGFLLVTLLAMAVLIGLDINTFILTGALIKEGRIEMTARHMLRLGLTSLKSLISPIGLILMAYVSLIFPILGLGVTIGPMKNFHIPKFITSVIYDNPLYMSFYTLLLLALVYISYRFIFSFHYILICGKSSGQALKASFIRTKKYGRKLIKNLLGFFAKNFLIYILPLTVILFAVLMVIVWDYTDHTFQSRFYLLLYLLIVVELVGFIAFLLPPMLIYRVTGAFYDYEALEEENPVLELSSKARKWQEDKIPKIRLKTKFLVLIAISMLFLGNMGLSYLIVSDFDNFFSVNNNIALIAHRGGGDLGAENTVEGILAAAKEEVAWSEIDVQRTEDGYYIINHDRTFKRVAGDLREPGEMTLEEIKELRVEDYFNPSRPSQPVPTLEEVIEAAKGKIGLFIELKGKTADREMVDDVVNMVKSYGVEKETVLLSLDYRLITYIEEKYPEMDSGYLYYFALGKTSDLKGDYLIMEEGQASDNNVERLKQSGKKVVVWTINTEDSIEHFINSNVDGIITDYVENVKAAMKIRDERTDFDIIVDTVLND